MRVNKGTIIPKVGERALVVGATGSGKSAFVCKLLESFEGSPVIIYDTKEEPKFLQLEKSRLAYDDNSLIDALDDMDCDYVIYRPSLDVVVDPQKLDGLLVRHYYEFHNVAAYLDEVYQFHKNGRPFQGLIGLLTRGRSRGITTIMSSQRPSYLSRFCITEAQKFYVFRLIDMQDKVRLSDVIPEFKNESDPDEFGFWYYESGKLAPIRFGKINLEPKFQTGYVNRVEKPMAVEPEIPRLNAIQKLFWI